jgi:hypothetical protein
MVNIQNSKTFDEVDHLFLRDYIAKYRNEYQLKYRLKYQLWAKYMSMQIYRYQQEGLNDKLIWVSVSM